jgi:hypothetical protein
MGARWTDLGPTRPDHFRWHVHPRAIVLGGGTKPSPINATGGVPSRVQRSPVAAGRQEQRREAQRSACMGLESDKAGIQHTAICPARRRRSGSSSASSQLRSRSAPPCRRRSSRNPVARVYRAWALAVTRPGGAGRVASGTERRGWPGGESRRRPRAGRSPIRDIAVRAESHSG